MENLVDKSPIMNSKKSDALDFIMQKAFRSGFGTLSKFELDAILFAAIMKFGDSERLTDLELSKYLQITQRKIQNLREVVSVKHLQMSRDEAIEEFISKLEFAKKDEIYIDIPIRNVAVKNEIEGILDENNILLHSQINTKIFRIRIDDLLELSIILESNDGKPVDDIRKQIIDKLRLNERNLISISQDIGNFDDNEVYSKFKNKLVKSTVDVGLELIRAFVPGGGIAYSIIEKLMINFGVLQNV